jgi:ketosteroid isomerase-like protein
MSQQNIDVHDRVVEAVNARRVPSDVLAPDFRMENRASAVTDYTYYGERGWREWMSDLFESFADGARFGVEEVLAVGDDFVAARFFVVGTGAGSGEPLEFRWTGVTWFSEGKAIRAVGYTSRREALDAVGLGD